jgi:hypothetical protein
LIPRSITVSFFCGSLEQQRPCRFDPLAVAGLLREVREQAPGRDGKAVPLLPSVCSAESAVGTPSGTDAISGQQTYNPSALFKE